MATSFEWPTKEQIAAAHAAREGLKREAAAALRPAIAEAITQEHLLGGALLYLEGGAGDKETAALAKRLNEAAAAFERKTAEIGAAGGFCEPSEESQTLSELLALAEEYLLARFAETSHMGLRWGGFFERSPELSPRSDLAATALLLEAISRGELAGGDGSDVHIFTGGISTIAAMLIVGVTRAHGWRLWEEWHALGERLYWGEEGAR